SGTAVSSVQSACLRSATSGISNANSHGPLFRRRRTSSRSRGVAAVRLATTRTRFFGDVSISAAPRCEQTLNRQPTVPAQCPQLKAPVARNERRACGARCSGRHGALAANEHTLLGSAQLERDHPAAEPPLLQVHGAQSPG